MGGEAVRLPHHLTYLHQRCREGQRCDGPAHRDYGYLLVRAAHWYPVNLELLLRDVDDPVLGDAGRGVQAGFVRAVER